MNDKETAMRLRRQFKRTAANIKVPEELEKENIIKMIQGVEQNPVEQKNSVKLDFSKPKSNKQYVVRQITMFGMGVAAAVAVLVGIGANNGWFKSNVTVLSEQEKQGGDYVDVFQTFVNEEGLQDAVNHVIEDSQGTPVVAGESEPEADVINDEPVVVAPYIPKEETPAVENGISETVNGKIYAIEREMTSKYFKEKLLVKQDDGQLISSLVLFESTVKDNSLAKTEVKKLTVSNDIIIIRQSTGRGTKFIFVNISGDPYIAQTQWQSGNIIKSEIISDKLWVFSELSIKEYSVPSYAVNDVTKSFDTSCIVASSESKKNTYLVLTVTNLSSFGEPVKLAVLGCDGNICINGNKFSVSNQLKNNKTEIYFFDVLSQKVSISGSFVSEGNVIGNADIGNDGKIRFVAVEGNKTQGYVLDSNYYLINKYDDLANGSKATSVSISGSSVTVVSAQGTYTADFN